MVIHGFAILLFTRGFLLTRSELSQYSQCSDVLQSPCFPPQKNGSACWTKLAVDRLVIIVLDALRFDFVAPSTFFPEKKPWMDKLHVLHEYASKNQSSAKIFKAIADPPTISLQRLKDVLCGYNILAWVHIAMGLLSIAVVTSTFAVFSAFAPNYISLVIFRMVVGIALGGGPVYSAWFLKFVPVQNRGIWMVIFSTFWILMDVKQGQNKEGKTVIYLVFEYLDTDLNK